MNGIRIPGLVYSILLAGAAALVEYFTAGPGQSMSYAPIIIAVVPVVLKMITVQSEPEAVQLSGASPRGEFVAPVAQPTKLQRLFLG